MKELLEAMLDLHTITLVRQKAVIAVLESKGTLTKAEVDSLQEQLSDADANEARDKVRALFASCLKDRLGWRTVA
jgi:hypothetical protein